jgi:ketosteroid isomerase-like protein
MFLESSETWPCAFVRLRVPWLTELYMGRMRKPVHPGMKRVPMKFLRLVTLMLVMTPVLSQAQAPVPKAEQQSLTETVAALDTRFFTAYNQCDLKTLGSMVSDDLEFYHDQTGLMTGKQAFLNSIQQNICGKVQRTIVPGTMEVDVLHHYGAVEQVTHRFHHPGDSGPGGEARTVMLWHETDGHWLLTRVISYDHHSL